MNFLFDTHSQSVLRSISSGKFGIACGRAQFITVMETTNGLTKINRYFGTMEKIQDIIYPCFILDKMLMDLSNRHMDMNSKLVMLHHRKHTWNYDIFLCYFILQFINMNVNSDDVILHEHLPQLEVEDDVLSLAIKITSEVSTNYCAVLGDVGRG